LTDWHIDVSTASPTTYGSQIIQNRYPDTVYYIQLLSTVHLANNLLTTHHQLLSSCFALYQQSSIPKTVQVHLLSHFRKIIILSTLYLVKMKIKIFQTVHIDIFTYSQLLTISPTTYGGQITQYKNIILLYNILSCHIIKFDDQRPTPNQSSPKPF
jgi:hypothetical protein